MSNSSPRSVSLHEQLAIEGALRGQSDKCRTQLAATFASKRHLFEEKQVVFTPTVEGIQGDVTKQSTLQTTVSSELDWVSPFLIKSLDASLQVAEANTHAHADIVLETGETVATGVPATALLELDKRIAEVKTLVEAIPTLDPAKGFSVDTTHAKSGSKGEVFKAREVRKPRTQKGREVLELAPATDKHPRQVQVIDVDKPIGTLDEQEWSGLITPAAKADIIDRVEILARAVKAARSRANNVDVNRARTYGSALVGYVFNGKV